MSCGQSIALPTTYRKGVEESFGQCSREPPNNSANRATLRYDQTKKERHVAVPFLFGAGRGIRTPVGLHPNGFQDRLVMTASIFLQYVYYKLPEKKCQCFSAVFTKNPDAFPRRALFTYCKSNSGGTSISSDTYFPFFLR